MYIESIETDIEPEHLESKFVEPTWCPTCNNEAERVENNKESKFEEPTWCPTCDNESEHVENNKEG